MSANLSADDASHLSKSETTVCPKMKTASRKEAVQRPGTERPGHSPGTFFLSFLARFDVTSPLRDALRFVFSALLPQHVISRITWLKLGEAS